MPDNDLLVLVICSFTKRSGGRAGYDSKYAVADRLGDLGPRLLHQRRRMREWVANLARASWGGQQLVEMELNEGLAPGGDFGKSADALYMEAVERYDGRFYMGLGESGRRQIRDGRHHFLIVSGLYGLVMPREHIQCYSCPVEPWSHAFVQWRAAGKVTLTDLVLAYAESQGITRVLDLMANDAYRNLVDWPLVHQRLGGGSDTVLHAYYKRAAGDGALAAFGRLVASATFDEDAVAFRVGRPWPFEGSELRFEPEPRAPAGYPTDCRLRWTWEDALGRMRRGAVRFMNEVDRSRLPDGPVNEPFAARATRLHADRRITPEQMHALKTIGARRDAVEYHHLRPNDSELRTLREAYDLLREAGPDVPEWCSEWEVLASQLEWTELSHAPVR
jgi:hypothetical protein